MMYPCPKSTRTFRLALPLAAITFLFAASFSATVSGQEPAASNEVQPIELGAKPDITCPGPVLVMGAQNAYVTFQGTQYDEQGSVVGDGVVVVQLTDCSAWDFRSGGDEELASHPVDVDSLDVCETFEVIGSDWAGSSEGQRHLIFTFLGFDPETGSGGVHFECLAQDANAQVLATDSFDVVLEYIDYLEMESTTPDDQEPESPGGDPAGEDPSGYDPGYPAEDGPESDDPDGYDPGGYDPGGYE